MKTRVKIYEVKNSSLEYINCFKSFLKKVHVYWNILHYFLGRRTRRIYRIILIWMNLTICISGSEHFLVVVRVHWGPFPELTAILNDPKDPPEPPFRTKKYAFGLEISFMSIWMHFSATTESCEYKYFSTLGFTKSNLNENKNQNMNQSKSSINIYP